MEQCTSFRIEKGLLSSCGIRLLKQRQQVEKSYGPFFVRLFRLKTPTEPAACVSNYHIEDAKKRCASAMKRFFFFFSKRSKEVNCQADNVPKKHFYAEPPHGLESCH